MTSRKTLAVPAVVAGVMGAGAGLARANEPTTAELLAQIQALQEKVQQMEAKQAPTTRQVDATVARVLADADRRSQLLKEEGFTSGWSNGKFTLASEDGKFTLSPNAQFQFRYVYNWTDAADADEDDDGFEIRRMKFGMAGNAFSEDLTYSFLWASDRNSGDLLLEHAYTTYKFADQFSFRVGQFKDPVHHEELVGSTRQLAVEHSLANQLLGGSITDHVQGVALLWDNKENLKGQVVYHDGLNTDNTNFQESGGVGAFGVSSPDFGMAARIEFKAAGDWKAYNDFTALGNKDDLLVFGAGGDWTQDGEVNLYMHTLDVQWESAGGLGAYGAYYGVLGEGVAADGGDTYDWGAVAQVGYLIPDTQWEIFGRGSYIVLDDERITAEEDNVIELTAGVNRYFQKHSAKMSIDATYLPNGTPVGASGAGIVASDDEDQFVVRGQFQLLI